jgi:NADH-quinone oxidoreductase subunit G
MSHPIKVKTDTPNIKELRKNILELELINHPIDCPICDQAGECKLQDYYMAEGLYDSELTTPKNKKSKAVDLGSNVMLDQERCVLCIRCVRFTRDITKTCELGVSKRADGAKISTFPEKSLDNPYAMNVVDLCPVGALTSKDFRFKKRSWFLDTSEALCLECSRGCNVYVDFEGNKYDSEKIYRYRPRENQEVNGYFICDEGRLSYRKENIPSNKSSETVESFKGYLQAHNNMLLFLVSPECSLEDMYAIQKLATIYGAKISGYSDGYIDRDFEDDFLKKADKAPNRSGFRHFNIDDTKEHFDEVLEVSSLMVSFLHKDAEALKNGLKWIDITRASSKSESNIIVSPSSKTTSHYVNFEGLIQVSNSSLAKNESDISISDIVEQISHESLDFDLDKMEKNNGI